MIPKKVNREGPRSMDKEYCEGGPVGMNKGGEVQEEEDHDSEQLADHCGIECMHAMKRGDLKGFRDSFHTLVMHTMNKMGVMGEGK